MAYKPRVGRILPAPPEDSGAPSTSPLPVRPVRAVREVPDLTLSEFALGHEAYELEVPYLDETLWFVPNVGAAATLVREGISRGRIFTARELGDLASIPSPRRADFERIVRLKAAFGAEIVEVKPDADRTDGGGDASV